MPEASPDNAEMASQSDSCLEEWVCGSRESIVEAYMYTPQQFIAGGRREARGEKVEEKRKKARGERREKKGRRWRRRSRGRDEMRRLGNVMIRFRI